jgi:tRNA (cmo5U34)-methyltransferase
VVVFFLKLARRITVVSVDMEITDRSSQALPTTAQFDLVARIYPALERLVFGVCLDDARKAFFEEVLDADRVLLVGEGNGRFLKSLIARKRAGYVCVVERSKVMIRLAKNRAGDSGKVGLDFIEGDFRVYRPEQEFDCVVTHFFLDLFNPPSQLAIIEKMTESVVDGGTWINVDFVPARTLLGGILMSLQYAFFRVVSRIESKRCFDESEAAIAAGWTIAEAISYLGGLVVAKRYRNGLVPTAGSDTPRPTECPVP